MLPESTVHQGRGYISPLEHWDTRSAVRSKPRRLFEERDAGRSFFSAAITPVASHPLVLSRGKDLGDRLLTLRLYSYLDFTTVLEQHIVNPVLLRLTRDAFGFALPDDMKFDAHRIYCDEAYHAHFSVDIKRQVSVCTSIVPPAATDPEFAQAIRKAQQSVPRDLRALAELCAVVVSETLISGTLSGVPADPTVAGPIRDMFADHAADERTHHAYFTRVLETAWPQLDRSSQETLSPLFGDFITAFLMPDLRAQRQMLRLADFKDQEIEQIIYEAQPFNQSLADARHAARSTMRLLERTGILQNTRTRDYFAQLGLISDVE